MVLTCVSLIASKVEHFLLCLFSVYIFFGEMYSDSLHILKLILSCSIFYLVYDFQIFSLILWVSFHFLGGVL